MATTTTNIGLTKPSGSDRVQIAQLNLNSDIIDEKIGPVGNTSLQDQITAINNNLGSMDTKMLNIPLFNGDCNGITETCTVYVGASATSSPGPWSIMHTVVFDSNNAIVQYAFSVPYATMRMRTKTGNPASWTEWKDLMSDSEKVMNGCYADNTSKTVYSIPLDGFTEGAYWMAQMYIQTGHGSCGIYIVFMDVSSNVEVTKVSGNSAITFTGVRNGNYIALTASDTVWGGVRATTMNGWSSTAQSEGIHYVEVTIPVNTSAGAYKIGTFESLGIPFGSALLSAQCINANASVCIVTGLATYSHDIYVYIAETVAVANGLIRLTYMT